MWSSIEANKLNIFTSIANSYFVLVDPLFELFFEYVHVKNILNSRFQVVWES